MLGLKQVGIYNDFFELGGHSLLATQVISRVRTTFQVDIPLRNLFEESTVAGLAEKIQTVRLAQRSFTAPPIVPISRDRALPLPLSFAQERLWFLNQLDPTSPFYNISAAVRLKGSLNIVILEQTFDVLVRRHESLQTNFLMIDGQARQVFSQRQPLPLPIITIQAICETLR
ncbi:MAG: condensation domain-containing protein [Nostoc sp.]